MWYGILVQKRFSKNIYKFLAGNFFTSAMYVFNHMDLSLIFPVWKKIENLLKGRLLINPSIYIQF